MPDSNAMIFTDLALQRRLGPARVISVCGKVLEVETPERRLFARLAVAGLYAPVADDTVLVAETADAAYVIGVLEAAGPAMILAPGDLHLLAPNGAIVLQAGAVATRAAEIALTAQTLAVSAERAVERFGSLRRTVERLCELDAGEVRARVFGVFSLLAKKLRATAEEDVKIDGEHIHLG